MYFASNQMITFLAVCSTLCVVCAANAPAEATVVAVEQPVDKNTITHKMKQSRVCINS